MERHTLHIEATPDKWFALCDGRKVTDYYALAELLETLNDDSFNYHVTPDRNDFSTWIADVFNDEDLASSIRDTRNKFEMRARIYKHLFEKLRKAK